MGWNGLRLCTSNKLEWHWSLEWWCDDKQSSPWLKKRDTSKRLCGTTEVGSGTRIDRTWNGLECTSKRSIGGCGWWPGMNWGTWEWGCSLRNECERTSWTSLMSRWLKTCSLTANTDLPDATPYNVHQYYYY